MTVLPVSTGGQNSAYRFGCQLIFIYDYRKQKLLVVKTSQF